MRLRIGRPLPLHPMLFGAFFVVYLFAQNVDEAELSDGVRPLLLVMGVAAALLAIATLLYRNAQKAAIAASTLVILFFSYRYVITPLRRVHLGEFVLGVHRIWLPIFGALAVTGIVMAARASRRLPGLTKGLNFVAVAMVLINVGRIGAYELRAKDGVSGYAFPLSAAPAEAAPADAPDIYYIVFDRYGGRDTLREQFGFDNSPFLDWLGSKGFYVANSRGNYTSTLWSLASSLNMDYLDRLGEQVRVPSDTTPLRDAIRNQAVARFLQDRGYRYVHIGSWWGPTSKSPLADVNVRMKSLSEFSSVLYETTVLDPIGKAVNKKLSFRHREYKRVRFQFDQLAASRDTRGPKFVFAHLLSPHEPFVFERDGRFVEETVFAGRTTAESYLEQLRYINTRIQRLVEHLQGGPRDSVIILQSDEGPYEVPESLANASAEVLRRKFPILNAYYLPGIEDPGLYPTITPVNSFRKVFNLYFDAGLPMLPDRSFAWQDKDHRYTFVEVTDQVA